MLAPVLLPNALAGLGRHRPPLVVEAKRHLLEVSLLAAFLVPLAEQLCAVLASSESLADQLDLAQFRGDAPDVRPLVSHRVQPAPELHHAHARPVSVDDDVDVVGEMTRWPRLGG